MASGFFLGGIADSVNAQQALALKQKQIGIQQQYANQEQQRFQQSQYMKLREQAYGHLEQTITALKNAHPDWTDQQILANGAVAPQIQQLSGFEKNLGLDPNGAQFAAAGMAAGKSQIQTEGQLARAKEGPQKQALVQSEINKNNAVAGVPGNPDLDTATQLGGPAPSPPMKAVGNKRAQATESDAPDSDPGKSILTGLATKSGMLPESLDVAGRALASGNTSVLTNLGRGAQGGNAVKAVRAWAAYTLIHEQNLTPAQAADQLNFNAQNYKGQTAAQQAVGKRAGQFALAESEFENVSDLVVDASKNVPRTQFKSINDVTNAWREGTGDPNIVQFGAAINSAVNVYARAISPTGQTTISDKDHAREILQKGWSDGQIGAAIAQLKKEVAAAKKAIPAAQQTLRGKPDDPIGLFK